jgi:hypothetical protein
MPPGRCRRWRGCSSPRAKSREAPCAANDSLGGRQLGLGCSRAFDIKARAHVPFRRNRRNGRARSEPPGLPCERGVLPARQRRRARLALPLRNSAAAAGQRMAWAGRAAFTVTGSPPFGAQLARRLHACVVGSDLFPGFCVARSKSIEYELSWPIRCQRRRVLPNVRLSPYGPLVSDATVLPTDRAVAG